MQIYRIFGPLQKKRRDTPPENAQRFVFTI